jgi:hypothetical protein
LSRRSSSTVRLSNAARLGAIRAVSAVLPFFGGDAARVALSRWQIALALAVKAPGEDGVEVEGVETEDEVVGTEDDDGVDCVETAPTLL